MKIFTIAIGFILVFLTGFYIGTKNIYATIPQPAPSVPVKIIDKKVTIQNDLDLKSFILQDGTSLVEMNRKPEEVNQNEVFRVGAEIKLYMSYWPDDAEILKMDGILFDTFGPCWGIPEGKCLE